MPAFIEKPRILAVIPAYNAAAHLPELLERLSRLVDRRDMLVVDDGSTDATATIVANEQVGLISLSANMGKGAALQAGFDRAVAEEYDGVLTLDADLQHLPEEVLTLTAAWDRRSIVLGCRDLSITRVPPHRWLSNRWTSALVSIFSRQMIADSQCGFRLIPTAVIRKVRPTSRNYDFESELLLRAAAAGTSVRAVPVSTVYSDSRSYIRPLSDVGRFIWQIWRRLWY